VIKNVCDIVHLRKHVMANATIFAADYHVKNTTRGLTLCMMVNFNHPTT